MRIEFHGRNCDVVPRFKQHAAPRITTLENYFDRINDIRITLSAQRSWRTVEITLEADGLLLRSEERSHDELASFDKALDRLERQLRRYRDRVTAHAHKTSIRALTAEEDEATPDQPEDVVDADEADASEIRIIRTKSHALKPMTPEEAALQMELLGHDFFLFFDAQSEQVEVVYRRRDGGYGLIEPEIG